MYSGTVDQQQARDRFRFGEFELDVASYELRRDGRRVRLERRPMDLLILLVERQGELVRRSEIVERLWGQDVFIEVDTAVNTLVRKVRRALGDAPDRAMFVERVPGKGYRFIAPVERVPAVPLPGFAPIVVPSRAGRDIRRWAGVLSATAILATLGIWAWLRSADEPLTLAVLPFVAIGVPPGQEYLADALHDETVTTLGQVDPEHLLVVGRQTMMAYARTTKSLAAIGQELGAAYLVESGVRVQDGRVRVTVRLVRARDQAQIWSVSYDRAADSLLGLQNELSADIANQVRLKLSPERLSALARRHTQDAEAYDLYLRGLYFWNQLKPETNRRAIEYYTRATERDPDYAMAWAGLALVYAGAPINADAPPFAMRPRAREAAEQAVRTGPQLAEVQTAWGMVQFWLEWDWVAAAQAFRRAVDADPQYALAHRMVGITASHRGEHDLARQPMQRLRELEPLYGMNWALSAQVAFNAREFETALDFARQATVIAPGFYVGDYHLAMAAERLGRNDTALETLAKSLNAGNTNSKLHALRGYVLAKTGRTAEARDVLRMLHTVAEQQYVPPYAIALVHAGLGDRDLAFEWLQRAYDGHDVHLVALPTDAKWDPLRSDPRFIDIVKRCGFSLAG